MEGTKVEKARLFCKKLVRKEARNFYYGFLVLPPGKRNALYALYAFCRVLDDAVDSSSPAPGDAKALRSRFHRMIAGRPLDKRTDLLISTALQEACRRFAIPPQYLKWIVEGVLMDLSISRYRTIGELRKYLFGVASSVGLACIEIFGYSRPEARTYAVQLGFAMQLTNIIRDVKEDYARGRIYLPQEELKSFGVTEEELGGEVTSGRLRALLALQAERARAYFKEARKLQPLLEKDAASCPYALASIYSSLLEKIEKNSFLVLENRFSLPSWRKCLIMLKAKLRPLGRQL